MTQDSLKKKQHKKRPCKINKLNSIKIKASALQNT